MKTRFLRFVITEWNRESGQPKGVFAAAYDLLRTGELTAEEREQLKGILHWFEENLPMPDKPYITAKYIFWFKAGAQECIRRIWDLAEILKMHGCLVDVEKCEWPGGVIYQDEYQVAARPLRKRIK